MDAGDGTVVFLSRLKLERRDVLLAEFSGVARTGYLGREETVDAVVPHLPLSEVNFFLLLILVEIPQ